LLFPIQDQHTRRIPLRERLLGDEVLGKFELEV